MAEQPADPLKFEIDPLVVLRLGEELITDDAQAVAELVKNAYDADATIANVDIHPGASRDPLDDEEPLVGSIEVSDDGVGMDMDDIREGWLRIAASRKREMKEAGRTTAKKRTPLGDKGLGRLGAQRLAREVEITTRRKSKRAVAVRFSWGDFLRAHNLSDVRVEEVSPEKLTGSGTRVRLFGLKHPDHWTAATGGAATESASLSAEMRDRLTEELSRMISPYEGVSGFALNVRVDGKPLDLLTVTGKLLEASQAHYDLRFDGSALEVTGDISLALFRPTAGQKEARRHFERFVLPDKGAGLAKFLLKRSENRTYQLSRPKKGQWFLRLRSSTSLEDLGNLAYEEGSEEPASPGPWHGEVDSFDLGHDTVADQQVFSTASEYRKAITALSGVRVYRDGFQVRSDGDILGLAADWSAGRSWYGLKPATTMGYIAVSARENAVLVEKTDREGFVDTAASRNLNELLQQFKRDVNAALTLVRRGYGEYIKECLADEAPDDVEEDLTPEQAAVSIRERIETAETMRADLASVRKRLATSADRATKALSAPKPDSKASQRASSELREALDEAHEVLERLGGYLQELGGAAATAELLGQELSLLQEKSALSLEAISLGITAEALSHEILNTADQLEGRTVAAEERVQSLDIDDSRLLGYFEYVRSSVRTLRKQIAHLDPSLRFVRDRRQDIDLKQFLADYAAYYEEKWADRGIALQIASPRNFSIRMNQGKLTQILDNLVLNSEYWLVHQRGPKGAKKEVKITVQSPRVLVEDNGPGIPAAREDEVFEPFATTKPNGRGLGLYIARQFLESENCSIQLAGDKNKKGRLFRFVLDLSGAIPGSK